MDSENFPSSNQDSIRRIARLPSDLVNQIAAGEVVERPSSLIKELVENSLDAGSTRIEVHLKEGGLAEIAVIDDGCGICEEDLPLAVERHTTSKLNSFKDLENISTFGFRGEALSSIASVSDFSIRSRPRNSDRGVMLHVPYGQKEESKPIGCPPGTQIVVKNLFAQVPARFKFLRSQTTELSHCAKVFRELALGNPQTAFFLHHNDRLLAKFTATTRAERFKEVLKPDWEPLHLTDSIPEMAFEAFLSPFDWTQERGELTFFINQRPVKNRLLLSCLKQSYVEVAGPHHEPSGVFYLDIQGDWVDVNVHPQKLEVRFFRQEKIYSWILTSVKKQLMRLKREVSNEENISEPQAPILSDTQREFVLPAYPPTLSMSPLERPGFRFLGVLHSKYFLLENQNGLFILNPKAFWERTHFLKLRADSERDGIPAERLSVPAILSLSHDHFSQLQELLPLFSKLGFEIELFGDQDIAIKAAPQGFPHSQLAEGITQIISLIPKPGGRDSESQILGLLASKIAQTEGDIFPVEPILAKISELDETWTCPQGKPVLFKLSWNQLEQHFKSL